MDEVTIISAEQHETDTGFMRPYYRDWDNWHDEDDSSDTLSIGEEINLSLDEIDLSSGPTLDIETL